MSLEHRNEFDEFEEEYGEYVLYREEREEVLEEFHDAYLDGESLEKLLLMDDSVLEGDLFDYFVERSEPEGVMEQVRSLFGGEIGEERYAEFMQDFEVEPAGENMLYWCRYEP